MNGLGLDQANASQGLEPIPAGTICVLVMKIKPGNCGIDGLCKRSSKGDSEGLDVEYVVQGDKYDKRKIYAFHLLDGVTSGHAKAGEITRSLLRAIYEVGQRHRSERQLARRNLAPGQRFAGRLQRCDVLGRARDRARWPEAGRCCFWPDKNVISKVLRPGDAGYRKLDQPPPAPIERSAPPITPNQANGSPAVAPTAIAKPTWAE